MSWLENAAQNWFSKFPTGELKTALTALTDLLTLFMPRYIMPLLLKIRKRKPFGITSIS